MKNLYFLLAIVLFGILSSCNMEKNNEFDQSLGENNAVNNSIHLDTFLSGVPVEISLQLINDKQPPKITTLLTPTIIYSPKNIFQIKSPNLRLVSDNLPISTPGKRGVDLPRKIAAKGHVSPLKSIHKSEALPPSTSDIAYYNLQQIDIDQGLNSGDIVSIMEDSRGNLWLSSFSKGVSIYNGKFFTNLDVSSGLCSNDIWDIFEDSKGNIWFATDNNGICMYNGQNFTHYDTSDGLPSSSVKKIKEDKKNNLWFATSGGLCKFDGTNFLNYSEKEGLKSKIVNDIYVGSNNNIIASTPNGISIFDGVLFTHYSEREGLPSNRTTVVFEDSKENIWIGTEDEGICMFDGYTFFTFNTSHGISGNTIWSIGEDVYNNMWFGTANNGATKYNRSTFEHITKEQGLSNNSIRTIFFDTNQNVWFGTDNGINRYTERSFNNYTAKDGLLDNAVQGICEDKNGNLWYAHPTGLSVYNSEGYLHYTLKEGLSDTYIRDLIQDSKGNIWLTTDSKGAMKYDGKDIYSYTTENGLSGNNILSIFEDAEGNIWFGTNENGITKFDGTDFFHLGKAEGLASNKIQAITQDKLGNIWFGTKGGGLVKFNDNKITHFTKKEGLLASDISSLMVDTEGALWVGTESNGLSRFKNGIFTDHFTQNTGLTDNMIRSIIQDFEKNIWVGTEKGLNMIEPVDSFNYTLTSFGKRDGLKGMKFYPNSAFLDSDNRMWWGTGKSLIMLDLNKCERLRISPKISLNEVKISQETIDFRTLKELNHDLKRIDASNKNLYPFLDVNFDSIRPYTNCPLTMEVPYELNEITFCFYANDWGAPHKLKYSYMLEGFDETWLSSSYDDKAIYTFLPEGKYTFKIKAIGESNLWSEVIEFDLIVHPPWWRTMLAYIFYFLMIITLIVVYTTIRTTKLRKQRKILEQLVKLRTLEIVKQKEIVAHKTQIISNSINYAKRIQRAILPSSLTVKKKLANALIFFKPKDIVAGDFYWVEEKGDKILIAAADCTGHGVPGAMISLVCHNTLSRTVGEFKLTEPDEILNTVREMVIESFTNNLQEVNDSMDIALVSLNTRTNLLEFSGANNDLYIISDGEIVILSADKQPIGKYHNSKPFTKKTFQLKSGDTFYMLTDGYLDQFGGPKGKKFKRKGFLTLLLAIQKFEMKEQKKVIENEFTKWKGDLDQVDDVCVIGVRVL